MKYNFDYKYLKEICKYPEIYAELHEIYTDPIIETLNFKLPSYKKNLREDLLFFSKYPFVKDYLNCKYTPIFIENKTYENKLNNEEMLALVYDFYEQLDPTIFNIFRKNFDKRFTNLKLSNISFGSFYGMTYMSYNANEDFIRVYNSHTLSTVMTLIHEYAHAIMRHIKDNFLTNDIFVEIEGIFMEVLAQRYFEKYEELANDIKREKLTLLKELCTYQDKLNQKLKIINHVNNNENFDSKDYHMAFDISAYNTIPYLIGNTTALNLLNLYDEDKTLSINTFLSLYKLEGEDEYIIYEEIKNLGLGPDDYDESYVRKYLA